MTRLKLYALMLLVCLALVPVAYGYELGTHGSLTYNGYRRSVLVDAQFLKDLGIDVQVVADPFGASYYDVAGVSIKERVRDSFEGEIIQKLDVKPLSLEGWLLVGCYRP